MLAKEGKTMLWLCPRILSMTRAKDQKYDACYSLQGLFERLKGSLHGH